MTKNFDMQSNIGILLISNSIIGMNKQEPLNRFVSGMFKSRFVPASKEATIAGTYVEVDSFTGLSKKIELFRRGGILKPTDLCDQMK